MVHSGTKHNRVNSAVALSGAIFVGKANRQNGKIVSKIYFVNINLSVELYHIRDITFKIVLIFGKKALSYITCLYLTYTHKQY